MRIQKYLSGRGILSRRETERYILAGKIMVNGAIVKDLGRQIDPEKDKVAIQGGESGTKKKETIVINKPRGIVSSRIQREGKTLYELFPEFKHLHLAGRLDKESEGLCILTSDGVLARLLTGKEHHVEKEYEVTVQERVMPLALSRMAQGIRLSEGVTLPARTYRIGQRGFGIVLREGRNHQIRRMADAVGLTVVKLRRIRIGPIELKHLNSGGSRKITEHERVSLQRLSL